MYSNVLNFLLKSVCNIVIYYVNFLILFIVILNNIRNARLYALKAAEGDSSCKSLGKGKRKKFKVDDGNDFVQFTGGSHDSTVSLTLDDLSDEDEVKIYQSTTKNQASK